MICWGMRSTPWAIRWAADLTVQAVNSFSVSDATVTAGSIGRFLTESGTGREG